MSLDSNLIELMCEGLVSFRIENRLFAIPIGLVREINRHLDLTRVHRTPPSLRGLVNLRGQVVTVVDLGDCLGFGLRTITEDSRLVVLKENVDLSSRFPEEIGTDDSTVGLLVDRISDVLSPSSRDLEAPPPHLHADERSFLIAVCKTASSTVGIVNPAAIVKKTAAATTGSLDSIPGAMAGIGTHEGISNARVR